VESLVDQALNRLSTTRLDRSRSPQASLGLRTVAVFEATKGAIVLLLACGVLQLIHKSEVANGLTRLLHVSSEGKLSRLYTDLASRATDGTLWVLVVGALVYATVRAIAVYGLWRGREWAKGFEVWCTALYLPPELYWLLLHPSWLRCGVLGANVVTLLFFLALRAKAGPTRSGSIEPQHEPSS